MKKLFLSVMVALALFAIGLSLFNSKQTASGNVKTTEIRQSDKKAALPESAQTSSFSIQPQLELTQEPNDLGFTDQDIADVNWWTNKSFLHPDFAGSDYAAYDEETLVNMINAGDVMAMKALWLRYSRSGDPSLIEKQYELVEMAIIYGDREMFQLMAAIVKLTDSLGNSDATDDQKKEVALDYLAVAEFAGMRGQLRDKYQLQQDLFRLYPQTYSNSGNALTLTKADKSRVRTKAKEIYQYYEQTRINAGLGKFDNSVPPGVQKLFQAHKEVYLKELGENAM